MDKSRALVVSGPRWKEMLKDAWQVGCSAVVFGPGLALDSDAMQWAGFLLFFMVLLGFALREKKTVAEAREWLDEFEKENGK